ncbi:helix-hairpin-helix domain-containing protein ['Prunus avium' virescence phytoplasma]
MDINVLGKKTLFTFFQEGLIKKISDLYSLKDKYEQLKKLPGFQDKKIMNILDALEQSKNQSFDRILYGLGIEHVGIKIAKLLNKKFKNINNLKKVNLEELSEIPEIGPRISNSVIEYFRKEENIQEINLLKSKGLNFDYLYKNVPINNIFKDQKIVLTGTFNDYSRNELTNILEKYGASIIKNVSSKTDFLIQGDNSGSKLQKARLLKIKIMDENELNNILNSIK